MRHGKQAGPGHVAPLRVGAVNCNGQTVVRALGLLRQDPRQRIYVLRCGDCGAEYGAKGADVLERRCPCQGGRPLLTRFGGER